MLGKPELDRLNYIPGLSPTTVFNQELETGAASCLSGGRWLTGAALTVALFRRADPETHLGNLMGRK